LRAKRKYSDLSDIQQALDMLEALRGELECPLVNSKNYKIKKKEHLKIRHSIMADFFVIFEN